jgi:hypothetical protein
VPSLRLRCSGEFELLRHVELSISEDSKGKDEALLVYHWKEHDMTVTFTDRNRMEPVVQLAMGREVRTLELGQFTDFLLTVVEEGRKSTTAYLRSLGTFPPERNKGKEKPTSPICI